MSDLETVRTVALDICGLCLHGSGGECHTPGCVLWMNRAPDIAIHDHPSFRTLEDLIAARDAAVVRAEAAEQAVQQARERIEQEIKAVRGAGRGGAADSWADAMDEAADIARRVLDGTP